MSLKMNFHEMCLEIKTKFSSQDTDITKWDLLKECFTTVKSSDILKISSDYYFLCSVLIDSLRPTLFSEQWQMKLFEDIFLRGIHHEAFILLVRKLGDSCESYQQKIIFDILQKFLKGPSLEELFIFQCSCSGTFDPKYAMVSRIWNDLVTYIISLPERVANKTKGENIKKIFRADLYVPLILSTVIKVFSVLCDRISNNQNCTLEFLGNLIGRFSISGNSDIVAKRLCVKFIKHSESDFIWRKLSQNLIKKMPISSLESFITNLLLVIPWYGYVEWILGEETVKTQKLNFLMTIKLISIQSFKQKIILQNIIGHFASTERYHDQFWKIFELLLKNWIDSYNLKYQSHDQQIYFAVGLMICCGWFKVLKDTTRLKGYLSKVLEGAQIRIGSQDNVIQTIGMVVAPELISIMNPEAESLDFAEISDKKLKEYLESFTKIPEKPKKDEIFFEQDLKNFMKIEKAKNKLEKQPLEKDKEDSKTSESCLLDESDDDLEPYDLTNESVYKKPNHPLYLNDCLQGLIEQENFEWFEQCMKHAENLISKHSESIQEFAEEMTRVMLHLDNKFNIDNFETLRKQILVSLIVKCPLPVAKYLSTEFYEPNYNIQQRLDILDVFSRGCLQLSEINKKSSESQNIIPERRSTAKSDWQLVVEKRIAEKTRYITKGPSKPIPEPVENLFAPIAGFFFFPFIQNYYKKNKALKLFGEDGIVLGRLILTLGVIIHAASSSHHSPQMGEHFLEFLSSLWNHEDIAVREAILFALCAIYSSVPGYMLLAPDTNLQQAVFVSKEWLENVIASDLDVNCQVKASHALSFLLNIMKEELPSISKVL